MNLFENVKSKITTLEAAKVYGIQIHHGSMCCCPFHNDKHPSMKLDERFHCFGCQADGDVISFTARLFNLSPKDAALKLAQDFGLSAGKDAPVHYVSRQKVPTEREIFEKDVSQCYSALLSLRNEFRKNQKDYAPGIQDQKWDSRFASALSLLPMLDDQLDILLTGTDLEKKRVIDKWKKEKEIPMKETTAAAVYYESAQYAREHGELDQYRTSRKATISCVEDIEAVLRRDFDGMHLKGNCASEILDKYGWERVQIVLAQTILAKYWDGRFSADNKSWAAGIRLPHVSSSHDQHCDYIINTHPAVLNGYIGMVRKEAQTRQCPSMHEEQRKSLPIINTKKQAAHKNAAVER